MRHYLFEWGWGFTLRVPEDQLRFNGAPFQEGRLVLSYGDIVKSVTVLQDKRPSKRNDTPEDAGEDEIEDCYRRLILDIQEHFIEFSDAHVLFEQCHRDKIVHLLDVYQDGETLQIAAVYGFNAGLQRSGPQSSQDVLDFAPRARLSLASREQLGIRWPLDRHRGEVHQILARMDTAAYEASMGKEVVYDLVRLSFLPDPDGSELHNEELVFMRAKRLIEPEFSNDIFLELEPHALHPDDIGEDFRKPLKLRRRNFSERKQLLYRIADDLRANNNPQLLLKPIVLVRLRAAKLGPDPDMIHGLTRTERALRRALQANDGLMFATLIESPPGRERSSNGRSRNSAGRHLKVELQPGLFVRVPTFDQRPYDRGEMIALEQRPDGYRVAPVLPAHKRYLSSGVRPAVALPMDGLFKSTLGLNHVLSDDKTWQERQFRFSIAGLADVVATPGTYNVDEDAWLTPRAADFVQLMRTPPPHLVIAGLDKQGQTRIGVHHPSEWTAGRLEDCDIARGSALEKPNKTKDLDWLSLTFGDEPIAQVRERIKRSTWRYHDRLVGHWTGIDEKVQFSRKDTGEMSAYTGPIFFQGDEWRLRYAPKDFERIGFPVDELIRELRRDPRRSARSYPVAGPSRHGGLWVEMAPGRLVELPGAMLFVHYARKQWSLAEYHWQLFAAGDSVEVQVSAGDIYAPDRLILKSWQHGPRGAFANTRTLLPVLEDSAAGALRLGVGEFRVTLPVQGLPQGIRTVALTPDNRIAPADGAVPSRGDVVLLGIGEHGMPRCIGLSETTPLPAEDDASWKEDPLARDCRSKPGLAALIDATGGALPVTVEAFEQTTGRLTFSRRLQRFPPNRRRGLAKGQVIGLLAGNNPRLLVRCGGFLLPVDVNWLVAGLPDEHSARMATAQVLKDGRMRVWLSLDQHGQVLGSGLTPPNQHAAAEIKVRPVKVAVGEKNRGLLCEAVDVQHLYWLADHALGWVRLTPEQIHEHVVKRGGIELWVRREPRLGASDTISVVATDRAMREGKANRVGRELSVLIIGQLSEMPHRRRYLVESFSSRVLLTCETTSELTLGEPEPVEVIRRTSGDLDEIVTAPRGEQPKLIDLPDWMLGPWPQPPRREWNQILISIDTPIFPSDVISRDGDKQSLPELRALVASAYTWSSNDQQTLEAQVKIALDWRDRYLSETSRGEVELAPGLMVVLVLEHVARTLRRRHEHKSRDLSARYASHARDTLWLLATRAKRSLHSELLSRSLLGASSIRKRQDQLGRRVHELEHSLREPLKTEHIEELRGFARTIAARQATDLQPLGLAISTAIGDQQDIEGVLQMAPICRELIELSQQLPTTTPWLDKRTFDALRGILETMLQNDLDIVLLDPIE